MTARRRKELLGKAGIYVSLTAITLLLVFPFVWMVSTSLKNKSEMFSATPTLFPREITFENYRSMWVDYNFAPYLRNSLIVAVCTTLISLLVATFLAYGISRFKFRGKKVVFNLLILTQMFPLPLLIITIYVVFVRIGLIDSLMGLIIAYCTFAVPFATMMLKSYFDGLPLELEEAAAIDGCGPLSTYFSVVLPMLRPTMISVGILEIMWIWNDYLLPYLVLDRTNYLTIPIHIQYLKGSYGTVDLGATMALILLSIIPVIVFYLTCQKHIIKGVAAGAVKG